ncbi:MAG: hypothetical protein JO276_16705 [Sphingomonadaceae bacterium]|nr:hypothetical protein [Sphingomonadaceae bacterium]
MDGPEATGKGGGQGHPLPASSEAREGEIPEHLVREKGHGDDAAAPANPSDERIAPDGEPYEAEPGKR